MTERRLLHTAHFPWPTALIIGGALLALVAWMSLALAPTGLWLIATQVAIAGGLLGLLLGVVLMLIRRQQASRGLGPVASERRSYVGLLIIILLLLALAVALWPIGPSYAWVSTGVTLLCLAVALWLGLRLARDGTPLAFRQAQYAHQRGEDEHALALLCSIEGERPDFYGTYHLRAIIRRQCQDYAAAHEACRRLIALCPDLYYGHAELGLTLLAQGKATEARAPLERASRIAPYLAEAYFNLGLACAEAGDCEGAIVPLSRALRLGLRDKVAELIARYQLFTALDTLGHGDRARAELRRLRRRKEVLRNWRNELDHCQRPAADHRREGDLISTIERTMTRP